MTSIHRRYPHLIFMTLGVLLIIIGMIGRNNNGVDLNEIFSLITSIGATTLSIGVIASLWILLGGEPLELLIEKIINIQNISFSEGIRGTYIRRSNLPIDEIHLAMSKSKNVFILAKYFQAFRYERVHETFKKCLSNGGEIRILLYEPTDGKQNVETIRQSSEGDIRIGVGNTKIRNTLERLSNFKNSLSSIQKKKFNYKLINNRIIYVGLYGNEDIIYITTYLNELPGDDCPSFVCQRLIDKEENLHNVYKKEFDRLWNSANNPE